jgi:hypothetical protein
MFERIMKTIITTCLIATLICIVGCKSNSPKITRTTNAQAQWHVDFLNRRYASIFKTTNGVGVVQGWPDIPKKSVLNIGSSFDVPDHHGSKKYTVLRIEDDGVVIEYFSCFDHRSFGKNLIEADTGTVKLKWKLAQ